jgi:hypothetical protein
MSLGAFFRQAWAVRGPPTGRRPDSSSCLSNIESSIRARHRIPASGIVEILQFLALKVALDWCSDVSANFLNSERGRLERKPVYSAKNPALLVELRPLERSSVSIRIDENFINCPEVS